MSSTFVDPTTPTIEHLSQMSVLKPQLSSQYNTISNLFFLKHWHQLTISILSFLSNPDTLFAISEPHLTNSHVVLYEKVVLACDSKINPKSLAMIASKVADSLALQDNTAACTILETLLKTKKERLETSGTLYAKSKLVLLKLKKVETLGADVSESHLLLQDISTALQDGAKVLKQLDSDTSANGDTSIHSAYYEASKAYRKLVGPPELFFREGMSFLNYTPLNSLSHNELFILATDLSLAALTGDGVFNFGEVVNDTPILSYLNNSENAWLMGLMKSMAAGNVSDFQNISESNSSEIQKHEVLVSRAGVVQEKITLLALVSMVFERPSAERTLNFTDIAREVCVNVDKVEWVIMRALSLGLIKGSMDQVDGTVTVTWVMPRVLDSTQLKGLAVRFGEWAGEVAKEKSLMMQETIFA